jgi:prepilin-type N-terminal cleavage/methylation domain-containing protein
MNAPYPPTKQSLNTYDLAKPNGICVNGLVATKAMTLIEVLVVISILSVMVALLLPAIQMAKQSANTIACLSNLRQMGMANQVYAGDFNGIYVPAMYFDGNGNPNWSTDQWYQNVAFLDNFGGNGEAHAQDMTLSRGLICPTIRSRNADSLTLATYGMNASSLTGGWEPNSIAAAREGLNNSDIFMFGDGLDWLLYTPWNYEPRFEGSFQSAGMVAYRHPRERMNAVMYDGSAKSIQRQHMQDRYAAPWHSD